MAAPLNQDNVAGPQFSAATPSTGIHILQQALTAPPLETYQVSFWAYKGKASTVTVNYQPAAGQSVGQPFLRFDIPQRGLVAGADGGPLKRGDSVSVTLTIDPVSFSVEFQPSGLTFSKKRPATLVIWYENANPDLNGDGVVDATDQTLAAQLSFWVRHAPPARWLRVLSASDPTLRFVYSALYHFSEYAVSW